jgi:Phage Mu protein F like protein
MTTAPYVELRVNPTDLRPGDLPSAGAYLGTPADAIEAALAVTRAAMVDQMKAEVRGLGAPTHYQLMRIADLAWQAAFWRYRKISAPIIADAYLHAYRAADAGDVPMAVIYDLADKHAEKVGMYFHETSREALAEGFNSMVNRQIPARVAADRVLDAYGLTPRQMRGYASAKQFGTPVSDVLPRSLKARAREYIDRSFTQRTRKLSRQEEHNIEEQAKQFAWMWLQDKGRLNEKAQKLWITAKDEKVCPVCGPLHGMKVGINEQFKTKEGSFWSPGLHPNCRCVVRLLENRFSKADWDPKLHPRADDGRFGTKTRTRVATLDVDEEFARITALDRTGTQIKDPQQDLKFAEITQYGILPQAATFVSGQPKASTYVSAPAPVVTPVTTQVQAPARAKLKPVTEVEAKAKTKINTRRWMLVTDEAYDPSLHGVIQLNPGDEQDSYGSLAQARIAASREVAAQVDRWVEDALEKEVTFQDAKGNEIKPNETQLRQVASHYANLAQQHESADPPKERALLLPGPEQRGMAIYAPTFIGPQVGIDKGTFSRVEVVGVDRKHGRVPEPEDMPLPSPLNVPVPEFSGTFKTRISRENEKRSSHQKYDVPILEAEPYVKRKRD